MSKNFFTWFGFAALSLIFVQFLIWKSFVFEATYIQALRLVRLASVEHNLELGAICNTLENYDCSTRVFSEILKSQDRHKAALANLAIAQAKQGMWKQASLSFEEYFFNGGRGYDVMFWYAQALFEQGEAERGIDWLYKSLSEKSDYMEAANELVDQLAQGGRVTEALSLVASLTQGRPWEDPYWRAKIATIENELSRPHQIEIEEVRIPAVGGRSFYMPLRLRPEAGFEFFMMNPDSDINMLNFDQLPSQKVALELSKGEDASDVKSKSKYKLDKVWLGPWVVEGFEATACKDCPSYLGLKWLKKWNVERREHSGVHFLHLKP